MQIFSGSSNRTLATNVGEIGNVEISRFDNDEARVHIAEAKIDHEAVLLQSFSRPVDENIIEFCLIADALTRKGVTNLIGVIPWLGYSKQDKVFLPGEALSAKVIAKILQTTKVKKIITFDLHNRAITGFFDIPVVELSAKPIFIEYFKGKVNKDVIVVAPDEGAVKSSSYFARELEVPIVYMDKRRDYKTGQVAVVGMSGEVQDKKVIIVDDMIVTGSTMIETAKYLKGQGAKSVMVAATHHLYVPGAQEKLEQSEIDEVVVTDSVECKVESGVSEKLKILSIARLIVDEIGN